MSSDFDKTLLDGGSSQHSVTRTLGNYELMRLLGEGGMGQVHLARHQTMRRLCALKLLPRSLADQPNFVRRFHSEARLMANLNHPGIVSVHNFDRFSGEFFIEMEYIDGGDLQQKIQAHRGGIPPAEVKEFLRQILSAISYAHNESVIHRDLKPANILLGKSGAIKISDFGLAAVVGESYHNSLIEKTITESRLSNQSATEAGNRSSGGGHQINGTLAYMSPQTMQGEKPCASDDIFAVGVMAYYMLTGRLPSVSYKKPSLIVKGLHKDWDRFIARSIEEDPKVRFRTADEMMEALAKVGNASRTMAGVLSLVTLAGIGIAGYVFYPQIVPVFEKVQDEYLPFITEESTTREVVPQRISEPPVVVPEPAISLLERKEYRLQTLASGAEVWFGSELLGVTPLQVRIPFSRASADAPWSRASLLIRHPAYEDYLLNIGYGDPAALPVIEQKLSSRELVVGLPGDVPLRFVSVPVGRFMMGSPSAEVGRTADEAQREVVIGQPYMIGVTEVTQDQYRAVIGSNPSYYRRDAGSRPVEQILYDEITGPGQFLDKFNAILSQAGFTQWRAALPTEAEWEYACRAGTLSALNSGLDLENSRRDSHLDTLAVYAKSETSPVASFQPNAWGLYDMHGNVWEWTEEGVLRGGSFLEGASSARSASRLRGMRSSREKDSRYGFRIVLRQALK